MVCVRPAEDGHMSIPATAKSRKCDVLVVASAMMSYGWLCEVLVRDVCGAAVSIPFRARANVHHQIHKSNNSADFVGPHVCLHAIHGRHSEVGSVCVNNCSVRTQLPGAFCEN
jgi:hypothetical protein